MAATVAKFATVQALVWMRENLYLCKSMSRGRSTCLATTQIDTRNNRWTNAVGCKAWARDRLADIRSNGSAFWAWRF